MSGVLSSEPDSVLNNSSLWLVKGIKMYEKEYTYAQLWEKLRNFNQLALKAYSFIRHYSKRTGHIELQGNFAFIDIYLENDEESSARSDVIGQIFSEISLNGWKVKNVEIAFEKEIKISINLGNVVNA